MQKITIKTQILETSGTITMIYLVVLSIITYVCYLYTSPMFVLQALFSWVLIYNSALLLFGTSPTIDNIYFIEADGKSRFYPLLDGSDMKFPFSMVTEIFVCMVPLYIFLSNSGIARAENYTFLSATDFITLLLLICFGRKLIFLLRGIYRYGQQVLEQNSPRCYVQREPSEFPSNTRIVLGSIGMYFFYSAIVLGSSPTALYNYSRLDQAFFPYVFMLFISTTAYDVSTQTKLAIIVTVLTILFFHYADIPHSFVLFLSFLAILSIYLVLFWAKDILLRESYILFDEFANDELRQDIRNHMQSFINGTRHAIYLASSLYVIFVIFLFSVIFRLDFAWQFSKIFGLDYFFNVTIIP